MRRSTEIIDGWTVRAVGGSGVRPSEFPEVIPAVVPGCVHLDLIRAGILQHPDKGNGEAEQAWVGRTDFAWSNANFSKLLEEHQGEGRRVELVFESIDTVATVLLNGTELGTTANQFHPHRFVLESVGEELEVLINAPLDQLDELVAQRGDRPVNADGAWGVYSYLRKSACAFGWDWGPLCPGSGLLGPVSIESFTVARIAAVRPLVLSCDERLAVVEIHLDVDQVADGLLGMRALLTTPDGRRFASEVVNEGDGLVVTIEIPDPQRWWPRGLGEQNLCDLDVELFQGEDLLDSAQRRLGLRSVVLEEEGFSIRVNGERVFCKGANWIPDGLFPGTAPPEHIEKRVQQAAECGMNMLRVWGGGLYEHPAFYETCDRLGIMVWQDFMFACATYPEEDPYPSLIETEARYQVSRLSHHPSIVLWCGGNENVLAWRNWGWKERMPAKQTWGKRYFTELLPAICAQLDPSRPYWPDSPWSGSVEADPNDPDCGDRHTWDLKLEEVRQIVPRFASEFGHQSPPLARTIEEALGNDKIKELAVRQRAWGGDQAEYTQHLEKWFPKPSSPDEHLAQMHLMQARATSMAIEWLRSNGMHCGGALLWQLNDAWTGHSWSLIDVAGRLKPSWWAAKASFADRLLTVQPRGSTLNAVAVNDHSDIWQAEAHVSRMEFSGDVLAKECLEMHVEAGGVASVAIPAALAKPGNPTSEFLLLEAGSIRGFWFFDIDRRLRYPEPDVQMRFENDICRIEAHSFVRDLFLDLSCLAPSGEIDANLLTLLPGEVCEVACRGCGEYLDTDLKKSGFFSSATGISRRQSHA